MTMEDNDVRFVCHNCIGEQFLSNEVREGGTRELCAYCDETHQAFPLERLADRIHTALQEHYELTPTEPEDWYDHLLASEGRWEREGYLVSDVISGLADVSEGIAEDVTEVLSNLHGEWVDKIGWESPYENDALYEEQAPDDQKFRDMWDEFSNEIQSHSRFFSARAEELLGDIFGDLNAMRTYKNVPVIREVSTDDTESFVWRARRADSKEELEKILKYPDREIAPPPSRLAKAGRMNAEGIPVFYGAMDEGTCVAEVRALVGSHVVLAKFEFLRAMRLLDFDALAEVYDDSSFFDPECAERQGRAAFFRWLVNEISRPVMPQDESFEYIATQALSEYLANKVTPRLDGIIFRSTQRGGEGRNVVLFNHASRVEPYRLPEGSEVAVDIRNASDDDEGLQITIREEVPSRNYQDNEGFRLAAPVRLSQYRDKPTRFAFEDSDQPSPFTQPALRLDLDSIVVLPIESVKYKYCRHRPLRYRIAGKSPVIHTETYMENF